MKYLILVLALILPLRAHAFNILYNSPQGDQRLEGFGPGGYTNGVVVWDESRDGPLPAGATIGYAERYLDASGKPQLRANATMQAAYNAAQAAAAAAATQKIADLAAWTALKAKINGGTATSADVLAALKMLIKNLNQ